MALPLQALRLIHYPVTEPWVLAWDREMSSLTTLSRREFCFPIEFSPF